MLEMLEMLEMLALKSGVNADADEYAIKRKLRNVCRETMRLFYMLRCNAEMRRSWQELRIDEARRVQEEKSAISSSQPMRVAD